MEPGTLTAAELRAALVAVALEWERRWGVAPRVTSAVSEYDAACLVGHSAESLAVDGVGRTAVTSGDDFSFRGLRYQVKACRPSGKPGSDVWNAGKVRNFDWDRLIWILYDREFRLLGAWEWEVQVYRTQFGTRSVRAAEMRRGRPLHLLRHGESPNGVSVPRRPGVVGPDTGEVHSGCDDRDRAADCD